MFSSGHGVFATKAFPQGSFLLEYPGHLLSLKEASKLEKEYKETTVGSFMFFFKFSERCLWLVIVFFERHLLKISPSLVTMMW